MEFSEDELKIIYAVFEISINAVESKKGHQSKHDIIALNHMRKINEKINNYMEGKE